MRRWQGLHRVAKFLRRTLTYAIGEGVLEFSRWLWRDNENFGPPQRVFSIYQALRTGYPKTNGRVILLDQGNPSVEPGSALATGGFNQYAEQPWPIFWSEHANARLVTRSLAMLGPRKSLAIESVYGHPRFRDDSAGRYFRLPPPVRLAGNWTSIVSRWVPTGGPESPIPNHSHWLLDALPRLALLSELPPDTQILIPGRTAEYQKDILRHLGVWERCRPTPEHHVEVERYFFSSPTSMLTCYNPYAVKFLRDAFLPKRDTSYIGPKKFFIKRRGLRVARNIDEVEQFFERAGWPVLEIERLTFAQELQLFYEAEAFSGVAGSGFTNAIFCKPGCKAFWFLPYTPGVQEQDAIQEWLAQVVGYEWYPGTVTCDYNLEWRLELETVRQAAAKLGVSFD